MTLYRTIAELRRTAGISQCELATISRCIYQEELSRFERGDGGLTPRQLESLKRTLRREVIRRRERADELLKAVS